MAKKAPTARRPKPQVTKPKAKPSSSKAATKKPAKPAPKPAPKPAAKPAKPTPKASAKTPAKAPASAAKKPAPAPKVAAKAAKTQPKGAAKVDPKAAAQAAAQAASDKASGRKGITIVSKPVIRRPKPGKPSTDISHLAGSLMGSGVVRRPLIASGPNAPSLRPLGAQGEDADAVLKVSGKTPFGKKDLERFRSMLVRKRAELLGDISHIEEEALRGESGSLSNTPQHLAEQGSETYEQSLQLDLAAADRKLLREIDDALARIEAGTFGVCEMTGKPIKLERLEELPWARYSIEAAREIERRSMRV
ncbi:MAG: TraR/DksA C4-type zinc finger protein [Phycisphaeraceae bacterium]|nr:MAG: TraR/DksA C4-type zinc finger protein [Phycisphaeraceae bacterium]